jgi:hypothetical protein
MEVTVVGFGAVKRVVILVRPTTVEAPFGDVNFRAIELAVGPAFPDKTVFEPLLNPTCESTMNPTTVTPAGV